jgi:hypothetical protein
MTISFTSVAELTSYLKNAEMEHHEYERQLGHRDEAWADWYARWIFSQKLDPHGRGALERNP